MNTNANLSRSPCLVAGAAGATSIVVVAHQRGIDCRCYAPVEPPGLPPYGLRSSLEWLVTSGAGERAASFAAGREHRAASIVVVPVVPQDRVLLGSVVARAASHECSGRTRRKLAAVRVGRNHSAASCGRTASSTSRTPLSMCPPANRNSPTVEADTQDRASQCGQASGGHSPILRRWSSTSPAKRTETCAFDLSRGMRPSVTGVRALHVSDSLARVMRSSDTRDSRNVIEQSAIIFVDSFRCRVKSDRRRGHCFTISRLTRCFEAALRGVCATSDFVVEDSSGVDFRDRIDRMRSESGSGRFGGAERVQ